jgi:hypothetical protein
VTAKQDCFHLCVEAGPDKDRRFTIPPAGARVGRSSGNDIVLTDPSLSRFHCRFFFKPDGSLWINDLGSTNATLVNGKPVPDRPLHSGDILEFGETRIVIAHDHPEPAAGEARASAPPRIDLGLGHNAEAPPRDEPGRADSKPSLVLVVVALAVIAVGAVFWMAPRRPSPKPASGHATAALGSVIPLPDAFDLLYEKEEGSSSNVFRYVLSIHDNTLAVQIDDAESRRHVIREKKLAPEVVQGLVAALAKSTFFDLRNEYAGVPQEGEWALRDLTLTLGRRTHRVRVANRLDPDEFMPVRESIETFAQNELGLAALSLPPERLAELARDAYQLAHKYMDEREVRPDNLFNAIRMFESCQWYLETVEPKPAYLPEAVQSAELARKDLEKEYTARLFEAEKAWNLSDWAKAAEQYRQILALIPDRSDERHQNALKKQLDVESRLRR